MNKEQTARDLCSMDIGCDQFGCGQCKGIHHSLENMSALDISEWHIEEIGKAYQQGFNDGYDAGYSEAVDLA